MSDQKKLKEKTLSPADLEMMHPSVAFRNVSGEPVLVKPWLIDGIVRGPNGGVSLVVKKKKLKYEINMSLEEFIRLASGEPTEH